AQKIAVKRFERLKEEGSSQLAEVAAVLAEQKLAALRREHIEVEGAPRTYSRFEIMANQIIDQEGLNEQNESVEAIREAKMEKAREAVLSILVRKRGTERLLSMIESDELFCRAIANRQRMTSEELLTAESSAKRHALNGVLFMKQLVLSEVDRRVFNGQKVLNEERERLLSGMAKDPMVFITGLSDEEIQTIRAGIPKPSNSRSIFDLAKERLKSKLVDSATDEELIGVMTQTVVGELLTTRSSIAVDLALRDLGIDPMSVLTDPENLTETVQQIIDKSLPYIRIDSTVELNQLKLERKGQRPKGQVNQQTVFRLLQDELLRPNPDQPLIVGKSEVVAVEPSTRGARKVIGVLDRLADLGVLQPRSQEVTRAIVHKANTAIFVELPLSTQRGRFVHTRVLAEDAKGKYGWGDAQNIKEITRCRVLTGLCLFSSSAVTAVSEGGVKYALTNPYVNREIDQPVIRIDIDQRIQPYEADSVLRLSEMIGCLNPEKVSSVALAVPRIEYWLYAMDAYEKGLIDSGLMLEWFNQVDLRAGRMIDMVTKRIAKPGLKINQVDPLGSIALNLVQDVQNDKRGLLPKLVEQLKEKSSLVSQTEIVSYSDLSYLSYVLGYLDQLDAETEMLIAVENPEETGILNRIRSLIGQVVSGKTIVGLYPHTNLVMSQDPETVGGRSLYFFDPKSRLRTALREVVRANRI
ncbi:MAG: hypothetical protein Q7S88_02840, partial [Candidatus Daviesbacteria bacterium]|nr:hypothetical protein [Candidatus Daviesbacteria bacterium]